MRYSNKTLRQNNDVEKDAYILKKIYGRFLSRAERSRAICSD